MIFKKLPVALAMVFAACMGRGMDLTDKAQAVIAHATEESFLHLPELARARPQLSVIPIATAALPGPKLLFSDMPEYLGPSNGVALLEDLAPGNYRLYIYHVPGSKGLAKTVSAVIKNVSRSDLRVTFSHDAFPRPGMDYPAMGVAGLTEFFTNRSLPHSLLIAPAQWNALDQKLEETAAAAPELVHTIYEFHVDQPARLAVLQRDTNQSSPAVIDLLPKLPRQLPGKKLSGAGRGLFPVADIAVNNHDSGMIDSAAGAQWLPLADGRRNPWLTGADALAGGITVTNKGNYGVIYYVHLAWTSSDGRGLAVLVGPAGRRSSGETRPMAALKINEGIWPGGWRTIVASRAQSRERGTVALIQKFAPPPAGETNYIDMIYSPPGGSSLPTPLYFVPFH